MGVLQYYSIFGEYAVVDFLKAIPYKESSQIGKCRFVAAVVCVVWCGSVSYPRAAVFLLC
jgi:hypothetical protein